jgi:hypothetical protein
MEHRTHETSCWKIPVRFVKVSWVYLIYLIYVVTGQLGYATYFDTLDTSNFEAGTMIHSYGIFSSRFCSSWLGQYLWSVEYPGSLGI